MSNALSKIGNNPLESENEKNYIFQNFQEKIFLLIWFVVETSSNSPPDFAGVPTRAVKSGFHSNVVMKIMLQLLKL